MINIPINAAESIFEPFWDGGESYPENQKKSLLNDYDIEYGSGAIAKVRQNWSGIDVLISKNDTNDLAIRMQRKCELSIDEYDRILIFASIADSIKFKIIGKIDGVETEIINAYGTPKCNEYLGEIKGSKLSDIKIEMYHTGSAVLYWIGMQRTERLLELNRLSNYSADWNGCLKSEFNVKTSLQLYFDDNELNKLREKMKTKTFLPTMNKFRNKAKMYEKAEPEKEIGEFFPFYSARFQRERDKKRIPLIPAMSVLAFVGIIDADKNMLRMACRMALCAAHSKYWCESIMGVFPGATWHHRSFTEDEICRAITMVLDWAGDCFTWHGRNIILDAIIMKGLPRINADFNTMDYIYKCNQGFMFNWGRIAATIALSHYYPRYKSSVSESEKYMYEMIDNTICDDGGSLEGISYWKAILMTLTPSMWLLSRYYGKSLNDYANERVKAFANYGLVMMRDKEKECLFIPVSDTAAGRINSIDNDPVVAEYSYLISQNDTWKNIYNAKIKAFEKVEFNDIVSVIIAPKALPCKEIIRDTSFITLNTCGQTRLCTKSNVGRIHLHVCGGMTAFTHTHGDKGSFILEINGNPVLIDPGITRYDNPNTIVLRQANHHNVFMPLNENGFDYDQEVYNCKGARVIEATYQNGVFNYITDVTNAWADGLFKKYIRSIHSEKPGTFLIEDKAEYVVPHKSLFLLNTYGQITECNGKWEITDANNCILVTPINYMPSKVSFGNIGFGSMTDDNENYLPLQQLCIEIDRNQSIDIITEVKVVA